MVRALAAILGGGRKSRRRPNGRKRLCFRDGSRIGHAATTSGGGLNFCRGFQGSNILWVNTAPLSAQISGTLSTFACNCVHGWTGGGSGNIAGDTASFQVDRVVVSKELQLNPVYVLIEPGSNSFAPFGETGVSLSIVNNDSDSGFV